MFAIGAVRFLDSGRLERAIFPFINIGENLRTAAAFADVAHHRSGNAVRELQVGEVGELYNLFQPFLHEANEYPNVAAFLKVVELIQPPHNMIPVVVFKGELDTSFYERDRDPDSVLGSEKLPGVYENFMEVVGIRLS